MGDIAKFFIFLGFLLIVIGGGLLLAGKIPGFGKLPGDILIKKENFTFYFPFTTSLLLSLLLSVILFFFKRR